MTMIIVRSGRRNVLGSSCYARKLQLGGIDRRPVSVASFSFSSAHQRFNDIRLMKAREQLVYPIRTRKFGTDSSSDENEVLYEGPFAKLTLRLKRVSISTAIVSVVGIPMIMSLNAAASTVPLSGQIVVGGTALLAATGSTLAMSFCFSPYVHTLERVVIRKCHYVQEDEKEGRPPLEEKKTVEKECLVKATTRNVLGMVVETVFDPNTDLAKPPSTSIRPFCNVVAKGIPLYVHPELLHKQPLRTQFLKVLEKNEPRENPNSKKDLEDDLF